jgi:hypothetical protein
MIFFGWAYKPAGFQPEIHMAFFHVPDGTSTITDEFWRDAYAESQGPFLTSLGTRPISSVIRQRRMQWMATFTHVFLPDSVVHIATSAFDGFSNLKQIVIPNSVAIIGSHAFSFCYSLHTVTIGTSVSRIGQCAFRMCRLLTTILIPDSVATIGDDAFSACTALSDVIIGSGVRNIGESAFRDCFSLKTITIPDSVVELGEWSFQRCTSLTAVVIGNSVTALEDEIFDGCRALKRVSIGTSVRDIAESAFNLCSSLQALVIPPNVTSISRHAFSGCSSLKLVIMSQRIQFVGEGAFSDCENLQLLLQPTELLFRSNGTPIDQWKIVMQGAFQKPRPAGDPIPGWMPPTVRIWASDEVIAQLNGPFADTVTLAGVHPDRRAFPKFKATQWLDLERTIYALPAEFQPFAIMSSNIVAPPLPFLPAEVQQYVYRFVEKSKLKRIYTDAALIPLPHNPTTPDSDIYTMFLAMGLPEDVADTSTRHLSIHYATRNYLWDELRGENPADVMADLVDLGGEQLAAHIQLHLFADHHL